MISSFTLKKNILYFLLLFFVGVLTMPACQSYKAPKHRGKVYIEQKEGKYILYRSGKPFKINGASGYKRLEVAKALGANTISLTDTSKIDSVLNEAEKNGIAVVVILPLANSQYLDFFYKDSVKVRNQHQAFKKLINRYKEHPALLLWCLGNELDFPYKLEYKPFYTVYNQLVDMIHQEDPDHPVTTTVNNFQTKKLFNILLRTDIDLISFNTFGRLAYIKDELESFKWFWNGPFIVTEWGIDGPWEGTLQTAWGAYIEDNSTIKAAIYLQRYKDYMPVENPRFLGSLVFYWGNKQETTHTWFSIFDENGLKTESVNAMEYIWSGKKTGFKAPTIRAMHVNHKTARDNVLVNAGSVNHVELILSIADTSATSINWEIYSEDWYKKDGENSLARLKPIDGLIKNQNTLKTTFIAPVMEGPYRIFVTIKNKNGYVANSNIPFYAVNK